MSISKYLVIPTPAQLKAFYPRFMLGVGIFALFQAGLKLGIAMSMYVAYHDPGFNLGKPSWLWLADPLLFIVGGIYLVWRK